MKVQPARIPGADGLRALACLMVVLHHTSQRLNPTNSPDWLQMIHFFGIRGEVGVSLFFVLSGCLLSLPFWNSFANKEPNPSIKLYLINRGARIIPAFWLNLIVCTFLALWVFNQDINWWRFISGLFFINSYHYSTFFPAEINGPLWSIGLEVSCYLLLPIVLFIIIKSTKKLSFAIATMTGWIILLQLLNPLIIEKFMTSGVSKGWQYGLTGGAKQWLPYWNVNTFFTQFLCGSLAALIIVTLRSRGVTKSRNFDFAALFFALAAIWLVADRLVVGVPDRITDQPYLAPFYAILMAAVLVASAFSTKIYKALDNRVFGWIAKLSFSIYLWHMVLIVFIERKTSKNYLYYGVTDTSEWVVLSCIVLAGSICIAALSWRFLESPVLQIARKASLSSRKN
jgi:peptidoglycan/LPS O-acetylase OafA/YrhL